MTGQNLGAPLAEAAARMRGTSGAITVQSSSEYLPTLDTIDYDTAGMAVQQSSNLTGTVAKTNGSQTLTGTGTAFTTELAVGDWVDVPGTLTERRQVTAITNNTTLTVSTPGFLNTASGQTATRIDYGLKAPAAGIYNVVGNFIWDSGTTGYRQAALTYNNNVGAGTLISVNRVALGSTATFVVVVVTAQWKFNAGDIARLTLLHTQAANITINSVASYSPSLAMSKVAPS